MKKIKILAFVFVALLAFGTVACSSKKGISTTDYTHEKSGEEAYQTLENERSGVTNRFPPNTVNEDEKISDWLFRKGKTGERNIVGEENDNNFVPNENRRSSASIEELIEAISSLPYSDAYYRLCIVIKGKVDMDRESDINEDDNVNDNMEVGQDNWVTPDVNDEVNGENDREQNDGNDGVINPDSNGSIGNNVGGDVAPPPNENQILPYRA